MENVREVPVGQLLPDLLEFMDNHRFIPAGGDPPNALEYAEPADIAKVLGPLVEVRCYDYYSRPSSHARILHRFLRTPLLNQRLPTATFRTSKINCLCT